MAAYPYIEFILEVGTWSTEGEAWPDTGFEGGAAIPLGVGREVVAEPDPAPWGLADGSRHRLDTWPGIVELDGRRFEVNVVALGERYLIGREVP
jgi:hypothetical protein